MSVLWPQGSCTFIISFEIVYAYTVKLKIKTTYKSFTKLMILFYFIVLNIM